ncbi:hypothetical protein LT493_44415 [Streptomyces tricolor]|nr:hypothetical protein [Streptomyces tricolor]
MRLKLDDVTSSALTLPDGCRHPQVSDGLILVSRQLADGIHEYRGPARPGRRHPSTTSRCASPRAPRPRPVRHPRGRHHFIVRYQRWPRRPRHRQRHLRRAVTPLQVTGPASSFRLTRSCGDVVHPGGRARNPDEGAQQRGRHAPRPDRAHRVPRTARSPPSSWTTTCCGMRVPGGPLHYQSLAPGRAAGAGPRRREPGSSATNRPCSAGPPPYGPRTLFFVSGDGRGGIQATPRHTVTPVHHDGAVGALRPGPRHRPPAQLAARYGDSARPGHRHRPRAGRWPATEPDRHLRQHRPRPLRRRRRRRAWPSSPPTRPPARTSLTTADDPRGKIPPPAADGRILTSPRSTCWYQGGGITVRRGHRRGQGRPPAEGAGRRARPQHAVDAVRHGRVDRRHQPVVPGRLPTVTRTAAACPADVRTNGTFLYWSCAAEKKAGIVRPGHCRATLPGSGRRRPAR